MHKDFNPEENYAITPHTTFKMSLEWWKVKVAKYYEQDEKVYKKDSSSIIDAGRDPSLNVKVDDYEHFKKIFEAPTCCCHM